MLLGKALNVLPGTHPEAQDYLTKSVKLNPKLGEAWVVLGECYWSKNDIETAKNCFQGALNHVYYTSLIFTCSLHDFLPSPMTKLLCVISRWFCGKLKEEPKKNGSRVSKKVSIKRKRPSSWISKMALRGVCGLERAFVLF